MIEKENKQAGAELGHSWAGLIKSFDLLRYVNSLDGPLYIMLLMILSSFALVHCILTVLIKIKL